MARGEAIKTIAAYGQLATEALMEVAVHDLIEDGHEKLQHLADALICDEEIILVADLIKSAQWYDQKFGIACSRKIAKQITQQWGLSGKNSVLAVLDDDETSSSADVAAQSLRHSLHQTNTSWTGTSILPGIGAASRAPEENIILVDDFIGTGNKAQEKIQWIKDNEVKAHNIYVATFVGQTRSRFQIGSMSTAYFAAHWRWKGITDVYLPDVARENIQLMRGIEKRFGTISKRESLGYGKTESTFFPVAGNTPNNVFPIFWRRNKKRSDFLPLLVRNPKL